jgi:hypothetical protein
LIELPAVFLTSTKVYVDDISELREADFFYHIIEAELAARNAPNRANIRRNPSYVAKVVATRYVPFSREHVLDYPCMFFRLHNSYMLASAWKIVSETLNSFAVNGVRDENIKSKLTSDPTLREQYLVLRNIVNTLVELSQNRFSVLATTTRRSIFFSLCGTSLTDS